LRIAGERRHDHGAELNRLAETGTDLDHNLRSNDDGTLSIDAVISPAEVQDLRTRGFDVGARRRVSSA
jgi:hypothetical protein